MSDLITAANLKQLSEAGGIRSVHLVPVGDRFALRARIGMIERTLRPAHGRPTPRLFKSIDSAARFVRNDLRLPNLEVDLANWTPEQRSF
jgi:hypothetical protein